MTSKLTHTNPTIPEAHAIHPKALSQNPNVSGHANLQNPLRKLDQVLYLDAHILDTCTTLEQLLQSGQLYTIFSDQQTLCKLLTLIHTLDEDTLHYPTSHDLINIMEDQDKNVSCEIPDNKDENKLFPRNTSFQKVLKS